MGDAGQALSPCPSAEELSAFCWGRASESTRAATLLHLAGCVRCRTQAARMMADAQSDGETPPPGGSR
jgi:hypothetical protein